MSAQRAALTQLVGKTITGVTLTAGPGWPRSQVFLTFSDNTYYELFSVDDEIAGASHLSQGGVDEVRACTADRRVVHEAVDTISMPPACETHVGPGRPAPETDLEPFPAFDTPLLSGRPPISVLPGGLILSADDDQPAGFDDRSVRPSLAPVDEPRIGPPEHLPAPRGFAPGLLAGRVIHDVGNALGMIGGFSELLITSLPSFLPEREVMREYLEWIGVATRDATHMIGRYRDLRYGHDAHQTFAQLHLDELVSEAIGLTRPKWLEQARASGRTIEIETELEPLPPILGDATELREVLTNLIHNAVDAIGSTGVITIRLERRGDDALLQISDTGIGMDEDVRRHALEPYFTTKQGQGSGLGLAIVDEIVARHGGTLDIESAPGAGTTVSVCFALALADADTEPSEHSALSLGSLGSLGAS